MIYVYTFIVLLGCLNQNGQGDTFGTGIIMKYEGNIYLVSCKHVYELVHSKNTIFLVGNLKQTKSPKDPSLINSLSKPYFHPSDNDSTSYDIVVFEILNHSEERLSKLGLKPLIISPEIATGKFESSILTAVGYPSSYIRSFLDNNSEEKLPPKFVYGFKNNLPLEAFSTKGWNTKLTEASFIRTFNDNTLGEGASGGLIFAEDLKQNIFPLGLLLGEGSFEYNVGNGVQEKFHTVVYASINRIIETIESIK